MLKKKKTVLNTPILVGSSLLLLFGGLSMYKVASTASVSTPVAVAKTTDKKIASVPSIAKQVSSASVSGPAIVNSPVMHTASGPSSERTMPVLSQMPTHAPALSSVRKPLKDTGEDDLALSQPVIINIIGDTEPGVQRAVRPSKPVAKKVVKDPSVAKKSKQLVKPIPKKTSGVPVVVKKKNDEPVVVTKPAISASGSNDFTFKGGTVKEVVAVPQPDLSIKYDLKEGKTVPVKKPVPIHATNTSVWVKLDATKTVKANQGDTVEGLGVYQGLVDGKVKFSGQLVPIGQ